MEETETSKYVIHAQINTNGVVERPDVVGAIFGQTEGLIGNNLDLRDLQKSGRVGRINVDVESKEGRSQGKIRIPTSLGKVEASVLAASLETIDRVGPCKAKIRVEKIEDVRSTKREQIANRARELITEYFDDEVSEEDVESVMHCTSKQEIGRYQELTAGPNVKNSDAIIIVEGRSDVLNLLKHGIKNALAVEGTDIPDQIDRIAESKTVTAFVDGDRGGELILKELSQKADLDYVAQAPQGKQVEDLEKEEITEALKNKTSAKKALKRKKAGRKTSPRDKHREEKKERKVKKIKKDQTHSSRSSLLKKAKNRIKKQIERKPEKTETEKIETSTEQALPKQQQQKQLKEVQEASQQEKPEEKPSKVEAEQELKRKKVQEDLENHFNELKDTKKARLFDEKGEIIEEAEVGELVQIVRDIDNSVKSMVLDGIITQRLLDIASEKKVEKIVGAGISEVVHRPASIDIEILEK